MKEDRLTSRILECAFIVHKALGPGLVESAYRNCMFTELTRDGLAVEMEKWVPLTYNGIRTKKSYRIDLLVEKAIVVEVKAMRKVHPVEFAQLETYLRLSKLRVGLLINFNVRWLKDGIKRIVSPERTELRPPLR